MYYYYIVLYSVFYYNNKNKQTIFHEFENFYSISLLCVI